MSVKPSQSANACAPIDVSVSGNVTLLNSANLHPLNALSPISVRTFVNGALLSSEHSANAHVPM